MSDTKKIRKVRRSYKFNYDDLGYLAGISGDATREWMKRRGLKLDAKKHANNLEVVAQFLNDRRGVSRESLVQSKKWDAFSGDMSRTSSGVIHSDKQLKDIARPIEIMIGDYGSSKTEPIPQTDISSLAVPKEILNPQTDKLNTKGNNAKMQKMMDILAKPKVDTSVDPRVALKRREDRYTELFMQGACHGEYDDYTQEEVDEMAELKTWLAGKAVA